MILIMMMAGTSCIHSKKVKNMNNHAFRLRPGADLKQAIQYYVNHHGIKAGWIVTAVGSLTKYNIRFANQAEGSTESGHFEILGMSGTVSENGSHIHITVADSTGKTIGGHLLDGNIIYTTAEVIIQEDTSLVFKREFDGTTEWKELMIERAGS